MENIAQMHTVADEISPLTLAFVGDGVYDLLVREYLVRQANRPVGELNKIKVSLVNCKSQARFAKLLLPKLSLQTRQKCRSKMHIKARHSC